MRHEHEFTEFDFNTQVFCSVHLMILEPHRAVFTLVQCVWIKGFMKVTIISREDESESDVVMRLKVKLAPGKDIRAEFLLKGEFKQG